MLFNFEVQVTCNNVNGTGHLESVTRLGTCLDRLIWLIKPGRVRTKLGFHVKAADWIWNLSSPDQNPHKSESRESLRKDSKIRLYYQDNMEGFFEKVEVRMTEARDDVKWSRAFAPSHPTVELTLQ